MELILEKSKDQALERAHDDPGEEVRVLVVDTHTLMREALYKVVVAFPRIVVCACLKEVWDAPLVARKTQAQVIILGSSIPVADCLGLVKLTSGGGASIGVVTILSRLSPETTMTFIKQGVQGLLGEDASKEDLVKAIQAAATGNTFLGRRTREILDASVSRAPVHLTIREVEVLSLLKSGESNFRIANTLGMREKTVEKHITRIYGKLNVRSRTEAILQAQSLCI